LKFKRLRDQTSFIYATIKQKIWDGIADYQTDLVVNFRGIVLLAYSPHGDNGEDVQ
jgi:hypothetical protein